MARPLPGFILLTMIVLGGSSELDACGEDKLHCDDERAYGYGTSLLSVNHKLSSVFHHLEDDHREAEGSAGLAVELTCVWEVVTEDFCGTTDEGCEEDDDEEFADCTEGPESHYFKLNGKTENLRSGDQVTVRAMAIPHHARPSAKHKLLYEELNAPLYEVLEVLNVSTAPLVLQESLLDQGAADHAEPEAKVMRVLSLILKYSDSGYPAEEHIRDVMFGGEHSFADIVNQSSYGRQTFPESASTILTVDMEKPWAGHSGCPHARIRWEAKEKLVQQHKEVEHGKYDYQLFYHPYGGGCSYGGLALYNCANYKNLPRGAACWSMFAMSGRVIFAHELGHNFGFGHALGISGHYNDFTAAVGPHSRSTYLALNRWKAGWLRDAPGEVITWTSGGDSKRIRLQAVNLPLNQPGADGVAVKIPWRKNQLWVSFHGDKGLSAAFLDPSWQNKVYVHTEARRKHMTRLRAKLAPGESYAHKRGGFATNVCSVQGDIVTVGIGNTAEEARNQCVEQR